MAKAKKATKGKETKGYTVSIQVGNGKKHQLDKSGEWPKEAKQDLAKSLISTVASATAYKRVENIAAAHGITNKEVIKSVATDMKPKTQDELSSPNHKFRRSGSVAVDQLKSIIARVEKLEEEKAAIGVDIKEVFAEAKGNGFDTNAIRTIIKIRKKDADQLEAEKTILNTYMNALGMLPLFAGLDDGDDEAEA